MKPNTQQKNPSYVNFLYANKIGSCIRGCLTKKKWFSDLSGRYCNTKLSKYHIKQFIKSHAINMHESEKKVQEFQTFNDFFIRKLKPSARPIDQNPAHTISPADGHVLVMQKNTNTTNFTVKDTVFNLERFFNSKELAQEFNEGTILIFRLAPWDYHRFHFPLDCTPSKSLPINGRYESVSPLVYKVGIQPLTENERHLTILRTACCGNIALVSVGALCVGKIIETYEPETFYSKGSEAGYFCFGGSTVVLVFKKGTITVSPHIIKNSQEGAETPIKMGQMIGFVRKP